MWSLKSATERHVSPFCLSSGSVTLNKSCNTKASTERSQARLRNEVQERRGT